METYKSTGQFIVSAIDGKCFEIFRIYKDGKTWLELVEINI